MANGPVNVIGGGTSTPPVNELPIGGDAGQLLAKATADDYDVEWIDAPVGGGSGEDVLDYLDAFSPMLEYLDDFLTNPMGSRVVARTTGTWTHDSANGKLKVVAPSTGLPVAVHVDAPICAALGKVEIQVELTITTDTAARKHAGIFIETSGTGGTGYRIAGLDNTIAVSKLTNAGSEQKLCTVATSGFTQGTTYVLKVVADFYHGRIFVYLDNVFLTVASMVSGDVQGRPGYFAYGGTVVFDNLSYRYTTTSLSQKLILDAPALAIKQWMNLWDNTAGSKSTSTPLAKGAYLVPTATIKIWGINAVIDDTGRDIKFAIYEVNSSGVQQGAALVESANITLTGKNVYKAIFTTPAVLTSGKYYAVVAVLQSGTTLGMCASTYAKDTFITGNNGDITAANTPADGITWTAAVGTAPYAIGLLIETGQLPAIVINAQNAIDIPPPVAHAKDDEFNDNVLDAKWAWLNQGSATWVESMGFGSMSIPSNSDNIRGLIQAAPAGDFIMMCKMELNAPLENYFDAGLILYNNSSGKVVYFGPSTRATSSYKVVAKFTNVTTWSADGFVSAFEHCKYLKITRISGVLTFYISKNGVSWTDVFSENQSVFLSTVTHIGIGTHRHNTDGIIYYADFDWFRVTE